MDRYRGGDRLCSCVLIKWAFFSSLSRELCQEIRPRDRRSLPKNVNINKKGMAHDICHPLFIDIYILGVSTEKPLNKPLERNVAYIPITTSSHATSMTSK